MKDTPPDKIRMVTATSLFDGHDAAINIMRRILQSKGAEIIHLGHNRSAHEIVECAIEEDAHGIAITSYQGGHLEFFKYIRDLLDESGCSHIHIFGGGGGTILPQEVTALEHYGVTKLYSPDDGRRLGLEGMIEDVLKHCGRPRPSYPAGMGNDKKQPLPHGRKKYALQEYKDIITIGKAISAAEKKESFTQFTDLLQRQQPSTVLAVSQGGQQALNGYHPTGNAVGVTGLIPKNLTVVLGITGTGGAGKSSVTDELVRRFLQSFTDRTIAVISVDPSRKKTGGALLGDRLRMNAISHPRAYMRSLATRDDRSALSAAMTDAVAICKAAAFDFIILESAGVGQGDASILDHCDISLYVMTPEYGAASQLEKINMLDYADIVCLNKSDKPGAADAEMEIRRQYKRNHGLWTTAATDLPVISTSANKFNDAGINRLFVLLLETITRKTGTRWGDYPPQSAGSSSPAGIIPGKRIRYLAEIADNNRAYDALVNEQAGIATALYRLQGALDICTAAGDPQAADTIKKQISSFESRLTPVSRKLLRKWPEKIDAYKADAYQYTVRDKIISQPMFTTSLSGLRIPKVVLPRYQDWGDVLRWQAQENAPGRFPFTAGVFPLKRDGEDPTRMFAGEGGPERTNRRFHYVSMGQPAKRLSTAFDSVTLYGEDPAARPDIYGKIGNSGVSIPTLDDAKKLYSGFDLCDPRTSVSMTINGPAPVLLAFFLNAAIDQQCEKWLTAEHKWEDAEKVKAEKFSNQVCPVYYNPLSPERLPESHDGLGLRLLGLSGDEVLPAEVYEGIRAATLQQVRGTVQADILKEDQAQNTCIFSTEFALKLMGDVQQYFISNKVRNFYSVSISGYHIAEAGANPVTQLAFTLSNGFTYVEYYLSRGMHIDDFAPNLSFFFSNGMDPEYSVIGRVARRIWAKAMKYTYKANKRSQMLKYHIQTSGRSLHAQEIDFNDIRTTLQALYAVYDNCNSLHTNAYDEAITTPTEESVRRAMAIQLIINHELGTAHTENFVQGSFVVEELTDLVEEAVLAEFDRISERGGVLGAMERMYQRNKIQEESLHYETLKHSGELPVVGVNTFMNKKGSPTIIPGEIIRSNAEEKDQQLHNLAAFRQRNSAKAMEKLAALKKAAIEEENLFAVLMDTVKYCSLGEITHALYAVGGRYRRNM